MRRRGSDTNLLRRLRKMESDPCSGLHPADFSRMDSPAGSANSNIAALPSFHGDVAKLGPSRLFGRCLHSHQNHWRFAYRAEDSRNGFSIGRIGNDLAVKCLTQSVWGNGECATQRSILPIFMIFRKNTSHIFHLHEIALVQYGWTPVLGYC